MSYEFDWHKRIVFLIAGVYGTVCEVLNVYASGEDANLFGQETDVRGTPDTCFCFLDMCLLTLSFPLIKNSHNNISQITWQIYSHF